MPAHHTSERWKKYKGSQLLGPHVSDAMVVVEDLTYYVDFMPERGIYAILAVYIRMR